jgi:hypothetical protein
MLMAAALAPSTDLRMRSSARVARGGTGSGAINRRNAS